jgi:hypothetical protein
MPTMDERRGTLDGVRHRPRVGTAGKIATLLWLGASSAAWACPSCNDAIGNDPVATALSWTTLLLIAMPLLLGGSIGGWIAISYWRAAREEAVANRGAAVPQSSWMHLWAGKESET